MTRRQKFVLVTVVLVVGVALALQFRRQDVASRATSETPTPQTTQSKPIGAPAEPTHVADLPPARPAISTAAPFGSTADTDPVPKLPATFAGQLQIPGGAAPQIGVPPSTAGADLPSSDALPGELLHKLADGDTLPGLAEHYLGSAARWQQLYDCNRDVLTSPELLPVGATLRIPTRRPSSEPQAARPQVAAGFATPPVIGAATLPVSQSSSPAIGSNSQSIAPEPAAETKLSPVGPGTSAGNGPAMLRLAVPPEMTTNGPSGAASPAVPAAGGLPVAKILRVAPSVYQVKPGDTLQAIAQRIYGDANRQQLLLEANRDRLRQPSDLRAGMTLVVPMADGQ